MVVGVTTATVNGYVFW